MDFEPFAAGNVAAAKFVAGNFAEARDFFYLAALFLGAGIGCILNRYRRRATARFRNSALTKGLCFFSVSVAALTAAIILSNWTIFYESAIYLPAGIICIALILAFRFPRAAGFPIFLVSGAIVVWISIAFLRFPVIDGSAFLRVSREGDGLVHVQSISLRDAGGSPKKTGSTEIDHSFRSAGENTVLEFRGYSFSLSRIFPLVGGVSRGTIAEIKSGNEPPYVDPRLRPGTKAGFPGIPEPAAEARQSRGSPPERLLVFREIPGKLEIRNLPPGTDLMVFFDTDALTFR